VARQLPSLNRLRAFEAAARHGSFKAAADELCVTQAAISHQVKALEDELGQPLFHRGIRGVRLLERAAPLAVRLTRSLDEMAEAVEDLTGPVMTGRLRLSVAPFFGNRWLLPRLDRFHARHPGLEIEPVLSFDLVDLGAHGFDAAVRYGAGDWPGLAGRAIYRDCVGPVVAPHRVAGHHLPMTPGDIARLPLATTPNWRGDWEAWFAAASPDEPVTFDALDCDSRALAFGAFQQELPAVPAADGAHVKQPQSEAFDIVYIAGGHTVEFFKNLALLLLRDANAPIRAGDAHPIAQCFGALMQVGKHFNARHAPRRPVVDDQHLIGLVGFIDDLLHARQVEARQRVGFVFR